MHGRRLPKIRFRDPQIEMAHGAGGKASRRLVEGLFAPLLFEPSTEPLGDAAHVEVNGTRVAITTDSFVVKPLRFPGGSIGELAVNGTVNDLAVSGARAAGAGGHVMCSKPGLPTEILEAEVRAMAGAARAGRSRDRGRRHQGRRARQGRPDVHHHCRHRPADSRACASRPQSVRPGDKMLLSGPIGDHGITILLARGELDLEADLCSDTRSVLPLVEALAAGRGAGAALDARSDARRRGHVAERTGARLRAGRFSCPKNAIPVRDAVRGACELLGLDPLHIANEGQFLAVVAPEYAEAGARGAARHAGRRAWRAIIGEVRRAAGGHGAGVHAVRRHADRRHAGGRSAAADLLEAGVDMATRPQSANLRAADVEERLLGAQPDLRGVLRARGRAAWRSPAGEMSERFLRGGRLLAFGRGPYATDAQHVSVEFVHPVIVGKRALPALDLSMLFGPWLEAHPARRRHRDGIRSAGRRSGSVGRALDDGARRGGDDLRAARRGGRLLLPARLPQIRSSTRK